MKELVLTFAFSMLFMGVMMIPLILLTVMLHIVIPMWVVFIVGFCCGVIGSLVADKVIKK